MTTIDDSTHSIAERQDQEPYLRLSAARWRLYASAKQLQGLNVLLAVLLIPAAGLAIVWPEARTWVSLMAVAVLVFEQLWLQPRQEQLREEGAKVQEEFDCEVLGLPWNDIKAGKRVPRERVTDQASLFHRKPPEGVQLTRWYEQDVAEIPLHLARIICQRENCSWEASQRKQWGQWMIFGLFGVGLGMLVWGAAMQLTVPNLLSAVVVPLAPALKLMYQQWREQKKAVDSLDRLRDMLERFWKEGLQDPDPHRLTQQARAIQDEIYEGRRSRAPLPEWVYARLKPSQEAQAYLTAKEMVAEAKTAMKRTDGSGLNGGHQQGS